MIRLSDRDQKWIRDHDPFCGGRHYVIQVTHATENTGHVTVYGEVVECKRCKETPPKALKEAIDYLKEIARSNGDGPSALALDYIKQLEAHARAVRQVLDDRSTSVYADKVERIRKLVEGFKPILKEAE